MRIFKNDFRPGFPLTYGIICLIYFVLSLIGILHHEIWLDEMHHFLLARDSGTIRELAFNARYDGHPLLWDSLLFFITRFTHNPFYMQLLNIILSLLAVCVFLRNAPFTDAFKLLFVFGYFMLYEYNIISRSYAVSFLLLFCACSLILKTKRNYAAILLVLFILCLTHLFSLICSVALFILTIRLYVNDDRHKIPRTKFFLLCFAFVVSVAIILWSLIPPSDHLLIRFDSDPLISGKRIGKGFSIFFKGFYHLPNFSKYSFWNTNWFVDNAKNFSTLLSLACSLIPLCLFYNKTNSLIVFYLASAGIALFIYFSPIIAGVRYFGYISMLFITALWISETFPGKQISMFPQKIKTHLDSFQKRFLVPFTYSFLALQFISSVIVYSLDLSRPFSEGKHVAEYLQQNHLTNKVIAVNFQSSGPPISGYLDKRLYYPETNDSGSFCKWNTHLELIDRKELITRVKKINADDFILVANDSILEDATDKSIPVYSDNQINIYYMTSFNKGIMGSENYRLYEVKRNSSDRKH